MKKLYLLLLLFSTFFATAQDPFITKWTVFDDVTDFNDFIIFVPIEGTNNNFTINFGDGTILQNQTGTVSHTYLNAGTYIVTISGNYKTINFGPFGTKKIRSIEQWGDTQWESMSFASCTNLVINATDVPDLSNVTSLNGTFSGCLALNQPLNNWDVSNVTQMAFMFNGASSFNQPLDNWDVSNVTSMMEMFHGAAAFNQSLNNWDVSSVTDMSRMFYQAGGFNSSVENWNTSNVIRMDEMFSDAATFNQPIDSWDVSSVITMEKMFSSAYAFNQPLNSWDVSSVTEMDRMFYSATSFNGSIENWDISSVTDMTEMFRSASSFNQPINNWDMSNVLSINEMFYMASSFNQPLDWDVSNKNGLLNLFSYASSFNQDLSGWDFSNFTFMGEFITGTAMDTANYDALLLKFAQIGLQNMQLVTYGLHYCDSAVRQHLITQKGWSITGDSLGAECVGNTILGNVRFDENGNGCNSSDVGVSPFLVSANNTTSMFTYSASASSLGAYSLKVPQGNYSVKLLNLPDYYTATPVTTQVVFNSVGSTQTLNFCLTANETINDLNITLLPLEDARPGFETDYQLIVQNMGTQSVTNATVNLTFDDTLQTFLSANPAPATTTANELTFNIANLQPFESKKINLTMQLFIPPVVSGGEISNFTATVTPDTDDFTPNNNTFELTQTIVNSFDPNDKRVLQGEEIFVSETDNYLDYIIRFQNTGTASAIKVRVKDVLDENLDWSTFQLVSASHNYKVVIKEGNQVEFIFDNINLPHESANEAGSHGFIAYKIKPAANIQVGDIMSGNASIYFDYNLPIITNVATTTVIENDIEPMQISVTVTNVSCNGANDGIATVTATGGSGNYTYTWLPSGGSEATAAGLPAGDYTATVTDGLGTVNIISITIMQPEAISITGQPEDVVLTAGGNTMFSVNASNVEQYQWQVSADGTNWNDINDGEAVPSYSGATTATINITGIPLGYDGYNYRVLLSNGDNCDTYSDEATIEVNAIAGMVNNDNLGVSIYPNPSQAEVFINIPNITDHSNIKISVLDINGRILLEELISENLKSINISRFESGVYIFSITSDRSKFSKQIIKE